jgi:general secretion pathway protein G
MSSLQTIARCPTWIKPRKDSACSAFTLIEVIVTLAILAVLAVLVLPAAEVIDQRARERQLVNALLTIRQALDAHKRAYDEGRLNLPPGLTGYPLSLESLVEGVPLINTVPPSKIKFLRRVPRDPMNTNVELSNEQTWGKRSYESEADQPLEGDNVYDVYSQSPKIGLNGIPYPKW